MATIINNWSYIVSIFQIIKFITNLPLTSIRVLLVAKYCPVY